MNNLFHRPVIMAFLAVGTIVGAVYGVLGYYIAAQKPEFVFCDNPTRAIIVNSSPTSKLKTLYDGKEIRGDISAVQVALWNRGGVPIRKVDILKTVSIGLSSGGRILDVIVRNATRDVVNAKAICEPSGVRISLTWDILERDDGFVVQIVYAGRADETLDAHAVIVGQKDLEHIELGENTSKGWLAIVAGSLLTLLTLTMYFDTKKNPPPKGMEYAAHSYHWAGSIVPICAVIWGIYFVAVNSGNVPPFPI